MYEQEDKLRQATAIDETGTQIKNAIVPPRRIWDLLSNRVVPEWISRINLTPQWAISHAWMLPEQRQAVKTPVNGFEWPVPIPVNTSLDWVRVELLNMRAEYVWLDVLCLRQAYPGENLQLRLDEWKLDVPTIGHVYHRGAKIVHYFSGLGKTFRIGDMSSPKHWLNRAWTLQEVGQDNILAGKADDSPELEIASDLIDMENVNDPSVVMFYTRLREARVLVIDGAVESIFALLPQVTYRSAESELDKIAGLAYLLRSRGLPPYITTQSPEEAWSTLLKFIQPFYRGELLFLFAEPGNGHWVWAPSWKQAMTADLPKRATRSLSSNDNSIPLHPLPRPNRLLFYEKANRLDDCKVEGLIDVDPDNNIRKGRLTVTGRRGSQHVFRVSARHQVSVSGADSYILVGDSSLEYWVVATQLTTGVLKKVTVLSMASEESERLIELRLCVERNQYFC